MVPVEHVSLVYKPHICSASGELDLGITQKQYAEVDPGIYQFPLTFGLGEDWEVDMIAVFNEGNTLKITFPMKVHAQAYGATQPKE